MIITLYSFSQEYRKYLYEPNYETASVNIELIHTDAYLKIDPYKEILDGRVIMSFKTKNSKTDSIVFSVPNTEVNNVSIDEKNTKFKVLNNKLIIYPTQKFGFQTEHSVEIKYISTSSSGLFYIG